MPNITLNNLSYYYIDHKHHSGVAAIYNLSGEIPNNSFSIIIGESGCGKTTLLKLIAGLIKPSEGKIVFDEVDVSNLDANARNISYVSQEFALYPHLTVFDNIAYPLKIAKVPAEEIRLRVNEVLELVGLSLYQSRKPKHLSIGQKQRVALARAIIKRPSLILLDEPLSNLDEITKKDIITILSSIRKLLPITIIYVTHKLDEVKTIGTNLLIINNGEIVQSGKLDEVLTDVNGFYCKNIGIYS